MLNLRLFLYVIFIITSAFISCNNTREETLSVCFAGDLLLDRGVREQIALRGTETLFGNTDTLLQSCDFAIANLECPVTRLRTPLNKQFIFRGEPQWLQAVANAGITHLTMANNHFNDQGRTGADSTAFYIRKYGMIPAGYGKNPCEACKPVILTKNKQKIAIFSNVQVPLENWFNLPGKSNACQQDIDALCREIQKFSEAFPGCPVIATLHWGIEYQAIPAIQQQKNAHALIDAGADAVIGHHPHVVQSIEIYRKKPVFYSLGNFIFDNQHPEAKKGIIVKIVFKGLHYNIIVYPFNIKQCSPYFMNEKECEKFYAKIFPYKKKKYLICKGSRWILPDTSITANH